MRLTILTKVKTSFQSFNNHFLQTLLVRQELHYDRFKPQPKKAGVMVIARPGRAYYNDNE